MRQAVAGAGAPVTAGCATFTANTAGAVQRTGTLRVTVPAGANLIFLRVTQGRPGGSTATYGEVSLFALGAAEPGADVTSYIAGPTTISVPCTSDGDFKAAFNPVESLFRLYKGGTQVTSGITWAVTTLSGTLTRAISGTGTGLLSITAITSESCRLRIDATVAGATRQIEVVVNKERDPPPVGGSGGSGNPGTTASTSTISSTGSTTYGGANAGPLTAKAGTAGQVALTANLSFQPSGGTAIGALNAWGKWQWRVVGGSWADVDSEDSSTTAASRAYDNDANAWINSEGYLPVAMTKTGLTSGTDYEFQLLLRVSSARTTAFAGLAKAEGS